MSALYKSIIKNSVSVVTIFWNTVTHLYIVKFGEYLSSLDWTVDVFHLRQRDPDFG